MADIDVGSLRAILRLDDDEFNKALRTADRRITRTSRRLQQVGASLQRSLTVPLAIAGGAVAKFGTDFEATVTRIETLVGVQPELVQEWAASLQELAPAVGRGPTELAEALFVVTSAGAEGAEALQIVETAAKASAIGLGETAQIARAVTGALKSYQDSGLSAAEATDILVATVREGNLEAADLAATLGRVTGIAGQFGVELADVGGFVASFTRVGVNAEEAVTALRGVLATIAKPTKEARTELAALGLTVDDLRASIRERGLAQTLVDLVGLVDGNQDAISSIIPNIRALSGVLATAGAQGQEFVDITESIRNSLGITDEAFERTTQTAAFQFAQLRATLEVLAIVLASEVLPPVVAVARAATESAQAASAAERSTIAWTVAIAALVAVLGPVLAGFGRLLAVVRPLLVLFLRFPTPIKLVVTAVLGLALNFDKVAAAARQLADVLFTLLLRAVTAVSRGLADLLEKASGLPGVGKFAAGASQGLRDLAANTEAARRLFEALRREQAAAARAASSSATAADAARLAKAQAEVAKVLADARKEAAAATTLLAALGTAGQAAGEEAAAAATEAAEALALENEQLERLLSAYDRGAEAVARVREEIELENAARAEGIDLQTEQGQLFADEFRKRQELTTAVKDAEEAERRRAQAAQKAARDSARAAQDLQDAFSDAFERIQQGGLKDFDALADGILTIFQGLQQNVSQITLQPGGGFVGQGIAGGGGVPFDFGNIRNAVDEISKLFGGLFESRERVKVQAQTLPFGSPSFLFEDEVVRTGPFGLVGLAAEASKVERENTRNIADFLVALDETVARVLDPAQIERAAGALQTTAGIRFSVTNFNNEFNALARDRLTTILEAVSPGLSRGVFQGLATGQGATGAVIERAVQVLQEFERAGALLDALEGTGNAAVEAEAAIRAVNDQVAELSLLAPRFGISLDRVSAAGRAAIARLAEDANREIALAILDLTDPVAAALDRLAADQERRLAEFRALGADLVELERLFALERAEVLEQAARTAATGLEQLLRELTATTASPLPTLVALEAAEERFLDLRARALVGEAVALEQLATSGRDFVDLLQAAFASGPRFFEGFDLVVSTLEALTGESPFATPATGEAQVLTEVRAELEDLRASNEAGTEALVQEVAQLRATIEAQQAEILRLARNQAA